MIGAERRLGAWHDGSCPVGMELAQHLVLPSPFCAGESHMDLRRLLQVHTRSILRSTPRAQVESDGEIQEGFSTVAGPQGGQRTARVAGGFVHCSCGDTVWRRGPLGHGHVWAIQGSAAAAGPAVAARDAQPRYFQPGLPPAGPAGVRCRIPPVHGRLRQGQRTGTAPCGRGGWQSLARAFERGRQSTPLHMVNV